MRVVCAVIYKRVCAILVVIYCVILSTLCSMRFVCGLFVYTHVCVLGL